MSFYASCCVMFDEVCNYFASHIFTAVVIHQELPVASMMSRSFNLNARFNILRCNEANIYNV